MCMYIYIYIYIYTYLYIYTHMYTYTHICKHAGLRCRVGASQGIATHALMCEHIPY